MALQRPPRAKDLARMKEKGGGEGNTRGGAENVANGADNTTGDLVYNSAGGGANAGTRSGVNGDPEGGANTGTRGGVYCDPGGVACRISKGGARDNAEGQTKSGTGEGDYAGVGGGGFNAAESGAKNSIGGGVYGIPRDEADNVTQNGAITDMKNGAEKEAKHVDSSSMKDWATRRAKDDPAHLTDLGDQGTEDTFGVRELVAAQIEISNANGEKVSGRSVEHGVDGDREGAIIDKPGKGRREGHGDNWTLKSQLKVFLKAEESEENIKSDGCEKRFEQDTERKMGDPVNSVNSTGAYRLTSVGMTATGRADPQGEMLPFRDNGLEKGPMRDTRRCTAGADSCSGPGETFKGHRNELMNVQAVTVDTSDASIVSLNNLSPGEKLQAVVEENLEWRSDRIENSHVSNKETNDEMSNWTKEHSLKEQKHAFDFGLQATHAVRGGHHMRPERLTSFGHPLINYNEYLYECDPDYFAAVSKVKFHLGGDEEADAEHCREGSMEGKSGDFEGGSSRSGLQREDWQDQSMGSDVGEWVDRQQTGRKEYDNPSGVTRIDRRSGKKKVSLDLPRKFYINESKDYHRDGTSRMKKRVSIEEPQPRRFIDTAGNSAWSKAASSDPNLDSAGNTGILKKQPPSPRQSLKDAQDIRSVSSSALNDGLMRYRRRSQLAVSPDIPVNVPLKHRQLENEVRNKSNLEFIKRRVSVQENNGFGDDAHLDAEPDGKPHGLSLAAEAPPPPRCFSSPGSYTHGDGHCSYSFREGHARRTGMAHVSFSNPGFSYYSPSPRDDSLSCYIGNNGSGSDSNRTSQCDQSSHAGRDGNFSAENSEHASTSSDKEPARLHSREGSVASSTIIIDREVNEEEMAECLGNIHPHRRRHGFPPSPRNFQLSDAGRETDAEVRAQRSPVAATAANSPDKGDGRATTDVGGDGHGDVSMMPYIPIRRQRISFQGEAAADLRVWTLRGHDNQAFQASPEFQPPMPRPLSQASSLDSVFSSVSSGVNHDQEVKFPTGRIRKDSLAIFNSKLTGSGRGRLRRLSQVSLEQLQQVARDHVELSRGELVRKYQLHVFVALIFLVTVLSVSLSWHYRNLATQILHSSQAIFFNPRTRQLTLTGPDESRSVSGKVGLDMPSWQLPLHCPIVMGNNPHAKECVWKNNAILRIAHFTSGGTTRHSQVECYNVSWESLHPQHVPHDCFDISDDLWYGPSNQSESIYPIRGKFSFNPSNYTVGNNGLFSTVVDFYWLSARGVALRVNGDDPVQVYWNQTGDNRLCILSNYTGPFYHQVNHVTAPHLNYTLCTGPDILKTHTFMLSMSTSRDAQLAPPSADSLRGAHWSMKSYLGGVEVNQTHVIKLAGKLQDSGFEDIKITMDNEWQATHGDLTFDPRRFPNVTEMFDDLSSLNCRLTLCVSPYFRYSSFNFEQGVTDGRFVRDAGGWVTGLADSEFGLAAVADITSPDVTDWFQEKLRRIKLGSDTGSDLSGESEAAEVRAGGFRLTYGRGSWLPYKPHFRLGDTATPNMFRQQMTNVLSTLASPYIVEHTSDTRHIRSLVPVKATLITKGDKRCLTDIIETTLTLGLMGYPYIMADGISAGSGRDTRVGELSMELYIRWLELATLYPHHQHPGNPWQFDEPELAVSMAVNLTRQNEALKMAVLSEEELLDEVERGFPIIRPVWWNESSNQTAHWLEIRDEFLLGPRLLVAPVLCEGVTSRDIQLPRGVWQDYHTPTRYVIGPATVSGYAVTLGQSVIFNKVADTDSNNVAENREGAAR